MALALFSFTNDLMLIAVVDFYLQKIKEDTAYALMDNNIKTLNNIISNLTRNET